MCLFVGRVRVPFAEAAPEHGLLIMDMSQTPSAFGPKNVPGHIVCRTRARLITRRERSAATPKVKCFLGCPSKVNVWQQSRPEPTADLSVTSYADEENARSPEGLPGLPVGTTDKRAPGIFFCRSVR
jgi:hypothetical protein